MAGELLRVAHESYEVASVERAEVMRYLGYRGQEVTAELEARIDEVVAHCLATARPRGSISIFAVARHAGDAVELEGCTLRLTGSSITSHLAGADAVALMAVTLGADIDRELRRLSLTDPLAQVVFDAAATAAIECAADAAEAHVRAWASERGAHTSWRFSPGYGDLPLALQPAFLAAIDATRQLGITLTPSNLMVPTKSVTAVVGIHPTEQPTQGNPCDTCGVAETCTIRQTGRTCRD